MTTKRKLVPARVVRHEDGRFRGLALERAGWSRLQLPVGARVIVETERGDVVSGEVVIDAGERLVRAGMDESDLRYPAYVRRPARSQ